MYIKIEILYMNDNYYFNNSKDMATVLINLDFVIEVIEGNNSILVQKGNEVTRYELTEDSFENLWDVLND